MTRATAATLTALVAAMFLATTAPAATWTDLAGNDNWSDAGNWNPGVPGSGDTATFDSSGASPATVDLSQHVNKVELNNGAPFTIDGTASLTVNSAGWEVLDAFTYTVSAPVTLNGPHTWDVAAGGTLDIQNWNNKNGGVTTYTKTGAGKLLLDINDPGFHDLAIDAGTLDLDPHGDTRVITIGDEATADTATLNLLTDYSINNGLNVHETGVVNVGTNRLTFGSDIVMTGGTINVDAGGDLRANGNPVVFEYNATANGGQAIIQGDGVVDMQGNSVTIRTFDIADNASIDQDMVIFSKVTASNTPQELNKIGAGTLVFEGDNDYGMPTNITAGTLLVNGTTSGQGLYTIDNGATLGGTGTIDAPVLANAGGILAPGASIGTLNVTNNDVDLTDAILGVEIDGGSADLLSIDNGALDLTNIEVNVGELTAPTATEYLIATATEGITLAGYTVTGDGNWGLQLRSDDTELFLVPEPATLALLGLGGAMMIGRRRRA